MRSEWWILWRRIAGGLDRKAQAQMLKSALRVLADAGAASPGMDAVSPQERVQAWMLAASLERVQPGAKRDMGERLLGAVESAEDPPQALWCIGRLGARAPVHGGIESVVPTDRAESWTRRLLELPAGRRDHLSLALMLLARRTDDRSRDVGEELRRLVIERLRSDRAPERWVTMVAEVVEDEPLDRSVLGEALPPGLRLLA